MFRVKNEVVVIVILIGLSETNVRGQVFRNSATCPQPPVQSNFDSQKFSAAKWYEIERYFAIFEMSVRCVTATFDLESENNVLMSFQATDIVSGLAIVINATGSITNPEEPAKISASFIPGLNFNMLNFWILDTDYDNYAVVWSCANFVHTRIEFGWIMSRKPTLEDEMIKQIHDQLDKVGVQSRDFMKSDQTNCPYQQQTTSTTERS